MLLHEVVSLYEVTDIIRERIAARTREKELSMRQTDAQFAMPMLMQTLRHAQNAPHGTTIVALAYKDGIIMAADRLATYGSGEVFSRDEIKLHNLETNSVIGICGMIAFAQHVIEDMEYFCKGIAMRKKYPVSIQGKSNLLKQSIAANRDEFLYRLMGVSFGAILGGYDRISGPAILSFDTEGGVYHHECFATDGSGGSTARNILSKHFQYDMPKDEAACLALAAIREAGRWHTSVSHPLDTPPTVKIIDKDGVKDIAEESITEWILETEEEEDNHLFANRIPHPVQNQALGEEEQSGEENSEGGGNGTA